MPKLRQLLAAASLATLALTGATACAADEPADASAGRTATGPESVAETIAIDASTTVIDVRTAAEFASGHLDGAVNIDVSAADFDARISALDPTAAYVVYCRSGNRSAQAAARMTSLGFDDVADAGGLEQATRSTGLAITN